MLVALCLSLHSPGVGAESERSTFHLATEFHGPLGYTNPDYYRINVIEPGQNYQQVDNDGQVRAYRASSHCVLPPSRQFFRFVYLP